MAKSPELLSQLFAWSRPTAIGLVCFFAVCGVPTQAGIPLLGKYRGVVQHTHKLGDWRLRVERNKFSGDIRCRLRSKNKKVVYVANALGFALGKDKNVLDAWVRIDGGQAWRWRNALPELARMGVAIDGQSLDAPTDGIVWIAEQRLIEANRVDIEWRPGKRPRSFRLRGFAGLREIARESGCIPDDRFVRK